jgi:hypothetical protein
VQPEGVEHRIVPKRLTCIKDRVIILSPGGCLAAASCGTMTTSTGERE